MGTLKEDLLRRDAYPDHPAAVQLVETHASWVFLAGQDVYKVKKPVDFGFLDFGAPEKRRLACEAELRLNARLAPDVYLGLVAVRRDGRGVHRLVGDGETVDWAVHMVRLPDETRADNLLAEGRFGGAEVDEVARRLARFHAEARCDAETARYGTVEAVERNIRENFAQTREAAGRYMRPEEVAEIEHAQTAFLRYHAGAFERRIAAGRIRDGHGDLRLEHVYLDGGRTTIVDCIEFNERFRFGDVCSDVAFLSMDLASHGRVDLAERLLARYAREADDFYLYELVDFYEGYRAYVRAKVSTLLASDADADDGARARAAADVRRHLLLSLASGRKSLLSPMLVCVGGLIASGKSTVAEALSGEIGAPVIDADRTRKGMLGVEPTLHLTEGAWRGAYDVQFTDQVYAELRRRAGVVLSSGRPVIVDATFRSRKLRHLARAIADDYDVRFCFVECRCPVEVCRERLAARDGHPGVSDARADVLDAFRAKFEAPDEIHGDEHLVIDTAQPLQATMEVLRGRFARWPSRSTP